MDNKKKNPIIAVLLSLLFPGLGHFYLTLYFNGIGYMIAASILWGAILSRKMVLMTINPLTFLFWLAFAAVYFYAAIECYRKAR